MADMGKTLLDKQLSLIVKSAKFSFAITVFLLWNITRRIRRIRRMKKIVVYERLPGGTDHIEKTLREDGWDLETIRSKKASRCRRASKNWGLLILGEPMHVYEQERIPVLSLSQYVRR